MEFFKGISRMMGFDDEEDDEELLEDKEDNYVMKTKLKLNLL